MGILPENLEQTHDHRTSEIPGGTAFAARKRRLFKIH